MQSTIVSSVLVCGLAISTNAIAQQIPAIETGPRLVTSQLINGELEMRDAATNNVIIARQRIEAMRGFGDFVTNVRLQQQPTGADIIIDVRNASSSAKKLGVIGVGVINLGENVEYFDSSEAGVWVAKRASTMVGNCKMYPDDLYSPAMVLRNNEMAVGVSLNYPVMDYKHDVKVLIDSPGGYMAQGDAGKGWTVRFGLANYGTEGMVMNEGKLNAGESRTYVVSIRITKNPQEWVSTLLPYRNFFRSTYGGVQYQRKTTPVLGVTLADPSQISAANPLGYRGDLRPDINGFARTKQFLLRPVGWPSTMLWMPTGLFNEHQEQNFPYQVGSQWNRSPQMQTALDPVNGLPGVPAAGRELGIWWGRSLLQSRTWNSSDAIKFDPDNPEHRARAFAELDGIAATGATMVGLDTFIQPHTPIWKSIPWLRAMKERHPQLSFVTEPAQCDVLHTVAATYVTGFNLFPPDNTTDASKLYNIKGPNIMADFINPGHETWGSMSYHQHRRFFGSVPDATKMEDDMRKFAEWGYRPVFFDISTMPTNVTTGPSWETSLPTAIVATDPVIQALKRGQRPNGAQASAPAPSAGSSSGSSGSSGTSGSSANSGSSGSSNSGTSGSGSSQQAQATKPAEPKKSSASTKPVVVKPATPPAAAAKPAKASEPAKTAPKTSSYATMSVRKPAKK
ncbi:MAG: hypothetical protein U0640_04355 [Phycisphaerales bacterium]